MSCPPLQHSTLHHGAPSNVSVSLSDGKVLVGFGRLYLPARCGQLFKVLQLAILFIAAHIWELPETLARPVIREVAGTTQETEAWSL